jgi:hypothetical protein
MFEFILACTISLKQRRLQKTLFHRFLCRSVGVSDVLVAREYLSLDSLEHMLLSLGSMTSHYAVRSADRSLAGARQRARPRPDSSLPSVCRGLEQVRPVHYEQGTAAHAAGHARLLKREDTDSGGRGFIGDWRFSPVVL